MVSSGTSVCTEQTPHHSLGTSSSRPENWHPISLDSVSPYHWYLGESAHPVLHWRLPNSLENSPDETGGNAFSLTCVHQFGGNSPLSHWELLWLPRKFAMMDLRDNQAESSAGFNASSKLVSLMSSLIWGPSNIPALIFSMLFCWNFWWRKANPLPSLSNAFTKFYMRLSLMWRGRSNILIGSTKGWYRTLCNRGFNPCLDGHTCLT